MMPVIYMYHPAQLLYNISIKNYYLVIGRKLLVDSYTQWIAISITIVIQGMHAYAIAIARATGILGKQNRSGNGNRNRNLQNSLLLIE